MSTMTVSEHKRRDKNNACAKLSSIYLGVSLYHSFIRPFIHFSSFRPSALYYLLKLPPLYISIQFWNTKYFLNSYENRIQPFVPVCRSGRGIISDPASSWCLKFLLCSEIFLLSKTCRLKMFLVLVVSSCCIRHIFYTVTASSHRVILLSQSRNHISNFLVATRNGYENFYY